MRPELGHARSGTRDGVRALKAGLARLQLLVLLQNPSTLKRGIMGPRTMHLVAGALAIAGTAALEPPPLAVPAGPCLRCVRMLHPALDSIPPVPAFHAWAPWCCR